MKKTISFLIVVLFSISVLLAGCGNQEPVQSDKPEQELSVSSQEAENTESESSEEENSEMKMNVNVNGQDFTATLENNSAVDALVQMMENSPVTLQLSDYAGFEKVGPLGQSLPASNSQTTTHA